MRCSPIVYKTFLVCCNFVLLSVGLAVLILGVKMESAMSLLYLTDIPIVGKTIKAVIAAGVFISISGMTGIGGVCYEIAWLLMLHLVSLGVIAIMEFSLGVTLMLVKKSVENAVGSTSCDNVCSANLDAAILEYALPSAGLMMTIIFVEALMIYSSIKLYFYIRDGGKSPASPGSPVGMQNLQMQSVATPQSSYVASPRLSYDQSMTYMDYHPQQGYTAMFSPRGPEQQQQTTGEAKPPDYNSLHLPPSYTNPTLLESASLASETIPKETDVTFNPV